MNPISSNIRQILGVRVLISGLILEVVLEEQIHKMRLRRQDSSRDAQKFVSKQKLPNCRNWLKTMGKVRILDSEPHEK